MNIFVRCTSQETFNKSYLDVVHKIADFINHGKHHLVTHAFSDRGLAQILSKAVRTSTHSGSHFTFIVNSDVLVFLPGGFGTLASLNYAIESKREHKHQLPIIIVNIEGFYDSQIAMYQKIYEQGFYSKKSAIHHQLYTIVSSAEELISQLAELSNEVKNQKE